MNSIFFKRRIFIDISFTKVENEHFSNPCLDLNTADKRFSVPKTLSFAVLCICSLSSYLRALSNYPVPYENRLCVYLLPRLRDQKNRPWEQVNTSPAQCDVTLFFTRFSFLQFLGYGHLAPSTVGGRVFCMIFALFGIPLNLMVLRHIGDRVNQIISYIHYFTERKIFQRESEIVATKTLMWTLLVLILMLFIGALLYLQQEQWNFLEGVYFCFITFSTIGFGDLVPNGGK